MDKKSKILMVIFIIIIFVSIYLTYRRSFITKDYEIISVSEEILQ